MDSGHPPGGSGGEDGSREKSRWAGVIKVYTRRYRRKSPKSNSTDNPPQPDFPAGVKALSPALPSAVAETEANSSLQPIDPAPPSTAAFANSDVRNGCGDTPTPTCWEEHGRTLVIALSTCSPSQARELQLKLTAELEQVRALLRRLESRQLELASILSNLVTGPTPLLSAEDPRTPMVVAKGDAVSSVMDLGETEPAAKCPASHTKTPLIVVKLGQANSGAAAVPFRETSEIEAAEPISSSNSVSHAIAEPPFLVSKTGECDNVMEHGQSNTEAVPHIHQVESKELEPVAPILSSDPVTPSTLPTFQETHTKTRVIVVKNVYSNPRESSQLELAEPTPPLVNHGLSNSGAFSHLDRIGSEELEPATTILPTNGVAGYTPLSPFQEGHPMAPMDVVKHVHSNSRNSLARLHRQLSILVPAGTELEGLEKEKRTPKANKTYLGSEFILGKDKLPSVDSKKSKFSSAKHYRPALKSCRALLVKLMNHNYAWVFNTPVDVEGLRLYDYPAIIKHPMDLGTIKSRLTNNLYRHPREFAEDVRLTFSNAMTYNPRGQDVHEMAVYMLQMFEDQWPQIEREVTILSHPPLPKKSHSLMSIPSATVLSGSAPHHTPISMPLNSTSQTPRRLPALQKPKAMDPHKRDMTFEEKRRLLRNLNELPYEKMGVIMQIMRKRNSIPDETNGGPQLEVEVDVLDVETLWELDRLATNYKKNLSKVKRRAELAILARQEAQHNLQARVLERNPQQEIKEVPKGSKSVVDEIQLEKKGDDSSESSTSSGSSSSSGSGSSSSDSDSDGSSG